jgi:hypothetical protein
MGIDYAASHCKGVPNMQAQKGIQPQVGYRGRKNAISQRRAKNQHLQMSLLWEVSPYKERTGVNDETIKVGMTVITPSGKTATVKKILSGTSKIDPFKRVVCQYVGGNSRDLVTLQVQLIIIQEE